MIRQPILQEWSKFDESLRLVKISGYIMLGWLGVTGLLIAGAAMDIQFLFEIVGDPKIGAFILFAPIIAVTGLMVAAQAMIMQGRPSQLFSPMLIGTLCAYGVAALAWMLIFMAIMLEVDIAAMADLIAVVGVYGWLAGAILFSTIVVLVAMHLGVADLMKFATLNLIGVVALPAVVWLLMRVFLNQYITQPAMFFTADSGFFVGVIALIVFGTSGALVFFTTWLTDQVAKADKQGEFGLAEDFDDDAHPGISPGLRKKKKKKRIRPVGSSDLGGPLGASDGGQGPGGAPRPAGALKKKKKKRPVSRPDSQL